MFLDQFGLNLLQIPREKARVGDLYAVVGGRPVPPARAGEILDPPPELPTAEPELLAELAGVVSDAVSVEAGLGLLEGFLTALGAAGLMTEARARARSGAVRGLRFRFTDATREAVTTSALGNALIGCRPRSEHPLVGDDYRYYLTAGVVRASSISVITEAAEEGKGRLDLKAPMVAEVAASVSREHVGEYEVRYRGDVALAIGVELVELEFDKLSGRVRFKPSPNRLRIRGPAPPPPRVFIGDPEGDAFVDLQ